MRARFDWILVLKIFALLAGTAVITTVIVTYIVRHAADTEDRPKPDVVLVLLDTARRDAFGCCGGTAGITPNVDRLAASGTVYTRCESVSSWTLPAMASIFTGVSPRSHGAGNRGGTMSGIPEDFETLPELAGAAGYQTAMVFNVPLMEEDYGFWQGFERVHDPDGGEMTATEVTDFALGMVDARDGRPLFLVVHYFDPHYPYDPPRPYWDALGVTRPEAMPSVAAWERTAAEGGVTAEDLRLLRALYLAEVHYADSEFGRLVDGLAERGTLQNTVFVVVGDHGEEFLEHGRLYHGNQLFEETVGVPLVIAGPGMGEASVREQTVSHVDVLPTLCAVMGADAPTYADGRDLMHGDRSVEVSALSSGLKSGSGDRVVVARGDMRLHWFPDRDFEWHTISVEEDSSGHMWEVEAEEEMVGEAEWYWATPELFLRRTVPGSEERSRRLRDLGYFN